MCSEVSLSSSQSRHKVSDRIFMIVRYLLRHMSSSYPVSRRNSCFLRPIQTWSNQGSVHWYIIWFVCILDFAAWKFSSLWEPISEEACLACLVSSLPSTPQFQGTHSTSVCQSDAVVHRQELQLIHSLSDQCRCYLSAVWLSEQMATPQRYSSRILHKWVEAKI